MSCEFTPGTYSTCAFVVCLGDIPRKPGMPGFLIFSPSSSKCDHSLVTDYLGGAMPGSQPRKMASKCPPRPLAAPPLCAWAHVQRGRDGQHLPLPRDAAGARGAGISLGGAVHCRAWLVGATRRKPANTPCTAARSAPLLLTLPPQGQSSFRFKASTRASAGRSPRFPTQDTLGWGRKRGLLAAISDWRSPRLAGCRSILHSADSAVLDQVIPVIYIYRNLAAVILTSC